MPDTDESDWPTNRDLTTFRSWFSTEFHSIVEDLCDYELIEECDLIEEDDD